ncbi:DICT sensory domain-containing protein [Halegenticoccus soli]|uniref:DICT sensory domain-containing protein n=1 Tax=Halegenticoccus soli TaxID=1985678 RepID=UPI000C6DC7A1|nr:DICT sensory domain-containing protein [Halegenticoccus soli]
MLGETIAGVASRQKRLTVFNYDGSERVRRRLDRFFSFHNVEVEYGHTDPDKPRNFVVLYDDDGVIATSTVDELREHVRLGDRLPVAKRDYPTDAGFPAVLSKLDDTLFTVAGEDRPLLLRIARDIEELAVRTGDGVLRAGFQRLSRLDDDPETRGVYERAAERGVEVHAYGLPDAYPDVPGVSIHGADSDEIARTWFVVYDGGGRRTRMAALVAEEREDGYYGFWTLKPYLVESVDGYLAATYAPDRRRSEGGPDPSQ